MKTKFRFITILLIGVSILLFILGQYPNGNTITPPIAGVEEGLSFSPLNKALLYDYPLYFELRDEFLISHNSTLLEKMKSTPFWGGIYDRLVNYLKNSSPLAYLGPMFEKISSGEVWRVFTPALLHFNLLHIFFNVLWIIILGNQIEAKIGIFRYLILIFATALFSNTAQYLMSGPFFMGLSGIVVGFVGFIYARQKKAPWEGYLLNRMTLIFLAAFIFGMFFLSVAFFILQSTGKYEGGVPIANTAHLVGGLVGYLLGLTKFFSVKREVMR